MGRGYEAAMNTLIAVYLAVILEATCVSAEENPWFENLSPGITRSNVLQIAGSPKNSAGHVDIYSYRSGTVTLTYEKDILKDGNYNNSVESIGSWHFFQTPGKPVSARELKERRSFLQKKDFKTLPQFAGESIYTAKYPAICYEMDGKFLVIEPIIWLGAGAGTGFYANKIARVMLVDTHGAEQVLYRASDHWDELRPPSVDKTKSRERMDAILSQGNQLDILKLLKILGEPDSHIGSGIDYRLFYLDDCLAIISPQFRKIVQIVKPGADKQWSYAEWRTAHQSGASPP